MCQEREPILSFTPMMLHLSAAGLGLLFFQRQPKRFLEFSEKLIRLELNLLPEDLPLIFPVEPLPREDW